MEGNWIHPDDRSKEFGALVAKGKGKTVKYLLSLALHRIGFGALRWVFDIYFFVAGVCHTLQILGLVSISGCGGHYYFWLSAFGHILTLVDELWAFGLKHCVVDARPFRAFSFSLVLPLEAFNYAGWLVHCEKRNSGGQFPAGSCWTK